MSRNWTQCFLKRTAYWRGNISAYQIRASVADGSPVLRKISLTSAPDTKPSMSLSVLLNSSSYFAFSAADTTHCIVNKTNFTLCSIKTKEHQRRLSATTVHQANRYSLTLTLFLLFFFRKIHWASQFEIILICVAQIFVVSQEKKAKTKSF